MKMEGIFGEKCLLVACVVLSACVAQSQTTKLHEAPKSVEKYGSSGGYENSQRSVDVSMVRLLASSLSLNGKAVTTTGVLSVGFEGTALYLNRESYHLKITDNAVGLRTLGTGNTDWESLDGMYVTVTGEYQHGPFARWPNGVIVDIEPSNPPTIVVPDFSITHAVVALSESESDHLRMVLKDFAVKDGFHFETGIFSLRGRVVSNYMLLRTDIMVGIISGSEPNTFMVRIYALTVAGKWAKVRDSLTKCFKKEFGGSIKVKWKKGDAKTP